MVRELALALAVVVPCSVDGGTVPLCSADRTYDPHVAVIHWSDGWREEVPTINGSLCQCVRSAAAPHHRRGLRIVESYCDHRNGFPVGWDTIKGYNR